MLMYTVTTATHPEGDVRAFRTTDEAWEYATELVCEGFDPIVTRNGAAWDYRKLHAEFNGWDV